MVKIFKPSIKWPDSSLQYIMNLLPNRRDEFYIIGLNFGEVRNKRFALPITVFQTLLNKKKIEKLTLFVNALSA